MYLISSDERFPDSICQKVPKIFVIICANGNISATSGWCTEYRGVINEPSLPMLEVYVYYFEYTSIIFTLKELALKIITTRYSIAVNSELIGNSLLIVVFFHEIHM